MTGSIGLVAVEGFDGEPLYCLEATVAAGMIQEPAATDPSSLTGSFSSAAQRQKIAEAGEVKHWNPLSLAEGLIWDAKWFAKRGWPHPEFVRLS